MTSDKKKDALVTEITPQSQDFSRWYLDVVRRAELSDYTDGQGLHGHPAVRLRDLGADSAGARPALQGDRSRQRLLPALHPREPADQGEGARRGFCAAGGVGHARRRRGARRAARRPADLRSHHRHDVRQVDQVVAGSAGAHQPVGQRRALGEGDAAVSAHDRVPLAGRAHRARDGRGGGGRDAEDPRALQGVRRERAGDAGHRRSEEREREVRGRVEDLLDRGADGRRPRAAGGHVAQPRPELRQGVRDPVPGPRQDGAACVDDVVGRVDAAHRRRDHDARRRQRPDPAAAHRAVSGRHRPDPPRQLAGDRPAQGAGDPRRARRPRACA